MRIVAVVLLWATACSSPNGPKTQAPPPPNNGSGNGNGGDINGGGGSGGGVDGSSQPSPADGGAPVPPGDPADLQARFPGSKLWIPANPHGAVVLLHGSEGGTYGAIWPDAMQLSNDAGVIAMALCWFGCPGTPDKILHVPLEHTHDAAVWLKSLPMINGGKVGLMGWSRGAEQSVLMASLLASTGDYAAVAVHAASDTIVCAYDPNSTNAPTENDPVTGQMVWAAAWTWNGALL